MDSSDIVNLPVPLFLEVAAVFDVMRLAQGCMQDDLRVQTGSEANDTCVPFASERFEPSSRTTLIGEQPNPWDLLQPQDVVSRHRGAELRRRYGRLGGTSLLSPG
jgi:hypothetical protein